VNTTVLTNANGTITRITVIHEHSFRYGWLAVAFIVLALLAWGLRAIFWNSDSN
jgi:hypothetical protein